MKSLTPSHIPVIKSKTQCYGYIDTLIPYSNNEATTIGPIGLEQIVLTKILKTRWDIESDKTLIQRFICSIDSTGVQVPNYLDYKFFSLKTVRKNLNLTLFRL